MRTCIFFALAVCVGLATATPLDDYINLPDDTYKWQVVNTIKGDDFTTHNIFLTSQTWLTANDTNHPVWTHWLQICVPTYPADTELAALYIDGGSSANINSPPGSTDTLVAVLCGTARIVAAYLTAAPNEPMIFTSDPTQKSRSEDAIIAFGWAHFIKDTTQPFWLPHLPMAKAGVRALDTIQAFIPTLGGKVKTPTQFVVAGASKRGWTTWLVGAVDKRVVGIIPVVAPVGNLVPHINNMYRSYGNFSFALDDYIDAGDIHYLNDPVFSQLQAVMDPLSYADRLTMPKLAIVDCGDEFFLPDGINYMWDGLKGEKLMRLVPNAEHSLTGHQIEVLLTVQSWILSLVYVRTRPVINWNMTTDGNVYTITAQITNKVTPTKVLLYHAYNPKGRDFRLIKCTNVKDPACIGAILWTHRELVETPAGSGIYIAQQVAPQVGYEGFFIEFEFDIGGASIIDPFKVTTEPVIMPNTYPYAQCVPSICGPN